MSIWAELQRFDATGHSEQLSSVRALPPAGTAGEVGDA